MSRRAAARRRDLVPRSAPCRTTTAPAVLLATLALATLAAPDRGAAQSLDEARAAARAGDYDRAVEMYAEISDREPRVLRERAWLLLTLARYEDALDAVTGPDGDASSAALHTVRGEALRRLGRTDEAEAAFTRALEVNAPDRNVALEKLALLRWRRGERERALESFDSFIDLYNRAADRLTPRELMAVGTAVRHLSVRDPDLVQDALLAYDEAAAAAAEAGDPVAEHEARVLTGELFLSRYNAPEAHASFDRVLAESPSHPGALLGKARVRDFDGDGQTDETARAALESAPEHPGVHAFLAGLHLATEDYVEAERAARRALETNPRHLEALSKLAALHYLRADTTAWEETRDRVLAVSPVYPELFTAVAELAVTQRRYHDAVELAGRAVAMDSTSWEAWGILGTNQLRTGAIREGRENLERAFAGDPFNPWYKNNLDLLDTFHAYETVETEHFRLFLHGEEAALLAPYLSELAEEAYAALAARYGAEPPTPVRVELFPSHADFSVRTLGLVGLGALGVSFGSTLVMDSPSAREPGDFNWASTFWHELAHAFHLGMTDHRVPRWFSEGLAVHEQRKARDRWGMGPSPAWLQAWREQRLHRVSELNEGFIRPDYPQQVVFSYYQSSLVFQMLEERWGFDAVLAFLEGYRNGRTTPELVPEVLGLTPVELDDAFRRYVEERFGERLAALETLGSDGHGGGDLDALARAARRDPGSYPVRVAYGRALYEAGRLDEAETELRAALRLFPEHGAPDGPYRFLARIHRDRGELAAAADALYQLARRNESLYDVHLEEADLREELDQTGRAADALARAVEVYPYDPDVHRRLATLLEGLDRWDEAVLERRAVLALEPVNLAEAHYRLAAALHGAGRAGEARSRLLRALEIAPTFPEALDLLVELRGGGT